MALDLRGHGETRTENDTNLSASVLCQDVIDVLETKYGGEDTKIVLVGHSMGGALAAKIAAR
jgi:protein phosphatase methylesterase 1